MVALAISGLIMGLSAGASPGPLMALVVQSSLCCGWRRGVWVALAPLITDIPVILASYLLLGWASRIENFVAGITLVGGAYVVYLGYHSWPRQGDDSLSQRVGDSSFRRALVVNIFSPHPYLFWFMVGAPWLQRHSLTDGAVFIVMFYFCLIGTKVVLALFIHSVGGLLQSRGYLYLMRFLALALVFLGFYLLAQGVEGIWRVF